MKDFTGIIFAVLIFVVASILRRKLQPPRPQEDSPPDVEGQWEEWIEGLLEEEGEGRQKASAQRAAPARRLQKRRDPHAASANDTHRTVGKDYSLKASLEKRHKKSKIEGRHITSVI